MNYSERDEVLRGFGYRTYADYLASELWAGIRAAAMRRYGWTCQVCAARAEVVHHLSYSQKVLFPIDPARPRLSCLAPLCHRCHGAVEFMRDGSKRTFLEASLHYYFLLRWRSKQTIAAVKSARRPTPDRLAAKANRRAKRIAARARQAARRALRRQRRLP